MTPADSFKSLAIGAIGGALVAMAVLVPTIARKNESASHNAATKMVFINTQQVVESLQLTMSKNIDSSATPEEIKNRASAKTTEMLSVLGTWSDRGYVVLDRRFILGYPPSIDITADVVKALGLELAPHNDPLRRKGNESK